MNRRKALRNILIATGVTAIAIPGYEWYSLTKKPHLEDLDNYKPLLAELAETIIPATNTPGAKDAQVGNFIYKMIKECCVVKEQNRFIAGLHDLEAHCHSKYGNAFINCSVPQREEVLNYFEKKDRPYSGILGKVQHKLTGPSFFETLKYHTVLGYCTSMPGATQGLAYDYIPGTFESCIPLKPGQRSWLPNDTWHHEHK